MFEILQKLFDKNDIRKLEQTLIITIPGGYELFGEYTIIKEKTGYSVNKYGTHLNEHFYNVQNATIYVSLHKRNMIAEAKRLIELDILLEGANAEMERHKNHKYEKSLKESEIISFSKHEEARHKRYILLQEVKDYMRETRSWQEGRFREAVK